MGKQSNESNRPIQATSRSARRMSGRRLNRSPGIPNATLAGAVKTNLRYAADRLRVSAGYPIYRKAQSAPVGAVVVSFYVTGRLADEIKKLVSADVVLLADRPPGREIRRPN